MSKIKLSAYLIQNIAKSQSYLNNDFESYNCNEIYHYLQTVSKNQTKLDLNNLASILARSQKLFFAYNNWQLLKENEIFSAKELYSFIYNLELICKNNDYDKQLIQLVTNDELINHWQLYVSYQMSYLKPKQLARSIHSLSIFKIKPLSEFRTAWHQAAINNIGESEHEALIMSIYSFLLIDLNTNNISDILIKRVNKILDQNPSLTDQAIRQVYVTYHQLNHKQQALISEKNKQKLEDLVQELKREKYRSSSLEEEVAKALSSLKITYNDQYWIQSIASKVDFYLPEYNAIIQVDGPDHFYGDLNIPSPRTELNSNILLNKGYKLYRLNYDQIDQCEGQTRLKKFIKKSILSKLNEQQFSDKDSWYESKEEEKSTGFSGESAPISFVQKLKNEKIHNESNDKKQSEKSKASIKRARKKEQLKLANLEKQIEKPNYQQQVTESRSYFNMCQIM